VAGAEVYNQLFERCRLPGFRYSPLGLRDGILAQMVVDHEKRATKRVESERWDSIRAAVAHYRVDMQHALQVREAAMQLFVSLKTLHRLSPEWREWLSAAAMLYEVGDYLNRNGRHRHAYYIISHSEILGYTPQQRRIIASIARYLGKSRPLANDGPMKILAPADRESVRKASLLLRLARAINLGRSNSVRRTRVRVHESSIELILVPKSRASVDLELWAVEKERAYFREVFGRELSAAAA
jgi:exopolyphosphatase / guanosine-5'-triphosphate,3'-diphosphate pyrophosphatase